MLGPVCIAGIGAWLARWRSPPAAVPARAPRPPWPGLAVQAPAHPAAGRRTPARLARMIGLALAGLLLAGLGLAAAATLDQARAQARWLADSLAPAVLFGQARELERSLQALQHLPQVQGAWVIGPEGQPLASHAPVRPADATGPGATAGSCQPVQGVFAWQLQAPDRLLLQQAVHYLGVPVGRLCLSVSLAGLYRQAAIAGLVASVLGLLAWRACLGRGAR